MAQESSQVDLTQLSAKVAARLLQRGETVAVAESAAGGLISASLLAVPGASGYYLGGGVVYTLKSRKRFLTLTKEQVAGLDPMTEAMALVFADAVKTKLDADWGIAELGIAGPGGSVYGFAPGSCVIGISGPKDLGAAVSTGHDDRQKNMWAFTEAALATFLKALD